MLPRVRHNRRPGAVAVEAAVVLPVLLLLVVGLIVAALGVFRYQQMAHLAREGARWASVHGSQYATDTGNAAATASDVYTTAILPLAVALDTTALTYSVTWQSSNKPYNVYTGTNNQLAKSTNTVTVKVTYHWVPEAFFGGMTLTSTAVMPMCY